MLICLTYILPVKMKTMIYHNHLPVIMFYLIFCCSVVSNALNASFSNSSRIRCLPDQSSALLQLKAEFSFDHNPFPSYWFDEDEDEGYPKMKFWKGGKDCCEWDGVRCSKEGQVVRLDLSLSWLQGPLLYNSTLFTLHQLQQLNLAFNDFNWSVIPSRFGHLSKLTHLNLSYSSFSGSIPSEIAWLSNLISLDLSTTSFMEIETDTLFQNMTKLGQLNLRYVNFSSALLESLANLSSLTSLFLKFCDLHGEFPKIIFQLPMIQDIDLSYNPNLTGSLPEFHSSSKLKSLILSDTSFYGKLPYSIGNLRSLNHLELLPSSFSGTIPSSIGNLSQLTHLDLSSSEFNGQLPSTLGNLTKLTFLDLSFAGFSGKLPSSLGNLMQLSFLRIAETEFHGQIPSLQNLNRLTYLIIRGTSLESKYFLLWMTNSTQLQYLDISNNSLSGVIPSSLFTLRSLRELGLDDNQFTGRLSIQNVSSSSQLTVLSLSGNKLNGPIPRSISKLKNLEYLDLSSNNLSGRIELDIFSKLRKLRSLFLSDNSLSVTYIGKNSTLPKFSELGLSSCSLGVEFPSFLRTQNELASLDISNNKIEGKIPKWFLNTSIDYLFYLNLSHNLISNWEQPPFILPWEQLGTLDLQSNALQGVLVVPPLSIYLYFVSKNQLSGRIHPLFCNLTQLKYLDVSNNHLSGSIPQCLGSSSDSLVLLNMKENNFSGKISHMLFSGSIFETLDLSDNQLQGKLPQSLVKCRALEVLNLGHNQIRDTFPFWLQNLPELQVLVLRSNKFYGPIWNPQQFSGFVKLRIVDLSFNNFSGKLPAEYFGNWTAMTMVPSLNKSELKYMGDTNGNYKDSVTLMIKGNELEFVKILTIYTSLDLSNNNFHGEIPSSIGDLQSLVVLNLSGNNFEGLIPSSLGNLFKLEFLDLQSNALQGVLVVPPLSIYLYFVSKNQLSGRIHPLFCNLTHLAFLDVSKNYLSGSIPQCLGSSSNSLVLLNMKGNNFSGKISHLLFNGSNLETLDLSDNQLQGKLPQSLVKCRALEVLNLGHNQIRDTFPFWLQNLPELQVLVLRSNKFYGPIWNPQQFLGFAKLRIVDLSYNNFSGKLPAEYFGNWTAMTMVPNSSKSELKYMGDTRGYYKDSVTLMNKGVEMVFVKILTIYTSFDLSNNNFHGEIPSTIGDLQSLVVLNLSGNNFEGLIPSTLGNLFKLESLDLSRNKLFGRIPPQLASLTFLEYLNVSENQLIGPIPEGAQFNTFPNSSFEGNVELCGFPLTKKCDNSDTPNPQHSQESESENGFGWKAVVMGYGCGFVVGMIVGHVVISRRPNFFAKIYGRRMW